MVVGRNFGPSKITVVGRNFGPSKITVVGRNFGPSKITVVGRNFGPSKIMNDFRIFGNFWTLRIFLWDLIWFFWGGVPHRCSIGPSSKWTVQNYVSQVVHWTIVHFDGTVLLIWTVLIIPF